MLTLYDQFKRDFESYAELSRLLSQKNRELLEAIFESGEGSRIAEAIDEKLRFGDIVVFGETVEERRRGVSPAALTRAELSFANQNAERSGDG